MKIVDLCARYEARQSRVSAPLKGTRIRIGGIRSNLGSTVHFPWEMSFVNDATSNQFRGVPPQTTEATSPNSLHSAS